MTEQPGAPASASARGGRRRWRWLRRSLLALAVLGALVAAANLYVVAAARGRIAASPETAPARPVAIVLGNRVFPGGAVSEVLAERLRVGLALYRAGRVQRLIVSGAYRPPGYDEPGAMAAWLARRGVPPEAIILDRLGHRTAATMAAAAAMGVRGALLCSQDYHLARALYLARHDGIDAVAVPAREGAKGPLALRFRLFVREALARAETVIEVAFGS